MNKPIDTKISKKDFQSDQEVRWCPGCGDYAILSAMQKTLPELGIPKEDFAIVSGIGCSSRFPYYMNTYGFHTIHGRAPGFASGLKLANPDLHVWLITGDGDALSIGGNHLIHALRRNLNINIILFNNEIYGLTKGQYSPTSRPGTVTKSSPYGSLDNPFKPLDVALGAGATFVARTWDTNLGHMTDMFKAAHEHKGTSFIEIYQNCVIFNDNVFKGTIGKEHKDDNMILLEKDKPLLFGKDKQKGIKLNGLEAQITDANDSGVIIHKPDTKNSIYAKMLAGFINPEFPEVFGILRSVEEPVYEELVIEQENQLINKNGKGDLKTLLYTSDVWQVS